MIRSISLSHNTDLGDKGANLLAEHLPTSIHEIGLVGCGIGDAGGLALLDWIKKSPQLRMVCIEQNRFSVPLVLKFRQLPEETMHLTLSV